MWLQLQEVHPVLQQALQWVEAAEADDSLVTPELVVSINHKSLLLTLLDVLHPCVVGQVSDSSPSVLLGCH